MANVSSADGAMTITAQSEQAIKDIFDGFLPIAAKEHWSYGIYAPEDCGTILIEHNPEDGEYSSKFTFWGEGRWSLQNTLENYPKFIADVLKEKSPELLAKIEKEQFEINLQYVDVEIGCCWIADQEIAITHTAGTPLDSSSVDVLSTEDRDWNFGNLREVTGMKDDELIDYVGGLSMAIEMGYEPNEDYEQETPNPKKTIEIEKIDLDVKKANSRTATIAMRGEYVLPLKEGTACRIIDVFKYEISVGRNSIIKITPKTAKKSIERFERNGINLDPSPEIIEGLLKAKNMTLQDVIQKGAAAIEEAQGKATVR